LKSSKKAIHVDVDTYNHLKRIAEKLNMTISSVARLIINSVDVEERGDEIYVYLYGGKLAPRKVKIIENDVVEAYRAEFERLRKEINRCIEIEKERDDLLRLVNQLSDANIYLRRELEWLRMELSNCRSHLDECKRRVHA